MIAVSAAERGGKPAGQNVLLSNHHNLSLYSYGMAGLTFGGKPDKNSGVEFTLKD